MTQHSWGCMGLIVHPCAVRTIDTLRFAALSEETGQHSPIPTGVIRAASIPFWVSAALTALARGSES